MVKEARELLRSREEEMTECVVAFMHIEENDGVVQVTEVCKEIEWLAERWRTKKIMLSGFAHLSDSHASPEIAKAICEKVITFFKSRPKYTVDSSHFGWNKSLGLNVHGHQGSFHFRSF